MESELAQHYEKSMKRMKDYEQEMIATESAIEEAMKANKVN